MKFLTNKEKLREIIAYLIVGVLTTIVNFVVYFACTTTFLDPNKVVELSIANVISWVIAVTFAYFTNRKFVFRSKNSEMLKEGIKFCSGRILTLLLEILFMFVMVSLLHFNDKIAKGITQVLVIIGNYIISKLFVFNKKINVIKFLNP